MQIVQYHEGLWSNIKIGSTWSRVIQLIWNMDLQMRQQVALAWLKKSLSHLGQVYNFNYKKCSDIHV